jgi:hypothetical protein
MIRFLTILCAAGSLLAQSDRGTLTGLVLDPAGAALPNARVEAVNQATQVKYTGVSSDAGLYSIPQLPVGRYDLSVAATGFSRYLRKDVDINIAQTVTINVNLALGAVNETVEVSGAAQAVQTSTSDIGTVVDRRMVIDLPLSVSGNMRNPESFIFLAPGVTGDTGNTQINGSQSRAKEVLFDGVGATSPESGGTLFTYPSVEAVSEFKLLGSNFSAEFGRTGGGFEVFNSKSGTNEFHGSAFDYLRNNVFDARGFYAKVAPVNRQNEFGGSIGGPMRIPGVYNGKNKTFFHFVYSGFRYVQNSPSSFTSIPPVPFRNGDFSSLVDRNGKTVPIYDPASTRSDGAGGFVRDAFAGNLVPRSRFSSVSSKIAALLPDPTNSGLLNNFLGLGDTTFNRDQVDIKIDHNLSDRNRLNGFVYIGTQTSVNPGTLPGPFTAALNTDYHSRWARLSDDFVISPTLLNHVTLGFTREGQFWASPVANQDWPAKIGLTGVNTGAGNTFPFVSFTDGYATWANTNGTKTVGSQVNNVWQLSDSVSWIHGAHSFKFGGDARWLQTNGADFFGSQGNFSFSNFETALPTAAGRSSSGNSFASFLLGALDKGQLNVLAVVPGNRYRYLASYVQDDWKVSRKLTLNLGMRYEIYFPRTEAHGNLSSFDPTLPNPGAGNRLGALEFLGSGPNRSGRSTFADTAYKNFGPRIGFAYALNEKTVLRGGFGIYYAPGNATAGLRGSQSYGFGFNASPVFASTDTGVTPAFNWDNGFPQNFARPPLVSPTVANNSTVNMIGRGDARPPYFQNWSFGLQRQLPAQFMVEADYVGVKGTRLGDGLIRPNELSPQYLSMGSLLTSSVTSPQAQAAGIPLPYPGFTGSVAQALRTFPQYLDITNNTNPNGNSTYHALQAKAEKRLSHNLTGLVTYAWSKSISDGNVQAGGGPGGQTYYNRRLEKSVYTDWVPQSAAISFLYDLPFGNHQGLIGKLAGGWTFTGIHAYSSGKPIQLTANNTLPLFNSTLRPNVVPGVQRENSLSNFDPAVNRYINPAAFTVPAPLTFGTAARSYTDLLAPTGLNESWGLIKRTRLAERMTLTFRAEFFNIFNRVVFAAPAANVSNANFGQISGQANAPRQGQISLRLEF